MSYILSRLDPLYLLGYYESPEDEEIIPDEKSVRQRHLLHKQLVHGVKLDKVNSKDLSQSMILEPSIKVGKVKKNKKSWSEVTKTDKNRFSHLDDTIEQISV